MSKQSYKVLNQILDLYSHPQLNFSILDSFLTIQMIFSVRLPLSSLATSSQALLLKKYIVDQTSQYKKINQQQQNNNYTEQSRQRQSKSEQELTQQLKRTRQNLIEPLKTKKQSYPSMRQEQGQLQQKQRQRQRQRQRQESQFESCNGKQKNKNRRNGKCKQMGQNYVMFDVIVVHQYGEYFGSLQNKNSKNFINYSRFVTKLMASLQFVFVLYQDGTIVNNVLGFGNQKVNSKPNIILVPIQTKSNIVSSQPYQELEKYISICAIYESHLNLRFLAYTLNSISAESNRTILFDLIKASLDYQNSQDDLDIVLRPDVPEDSFIKIIPQTGYRVNLATICNQNQSDYCFIGQEVGKYYLFKLGKDRGLAADSLIIWVLMQNRPILAFLPHLQKKKVGRKRNGTHREKYIEKRSHMGYSQFQMQDKLFQQTHVPDIHLQQSQTSIISSNSCCLSNRSQAQSNKIKQNTISQCTCIINITGVDLSQLQIEDIIIKQMQRIWGMFVKDRKQLYHDQQINHNFDLLHRAADILQVSDKLLYSILYLSKL